MVLIIPTISISHGVCGTQIATLAHETHRAGGEIYSQDPVERARLLRKENSKMIHLQFLDRDPWHPANLEIIARMRHAVDIPFGLSLADLPWSIADCKALFAAGIYRLFLPLDTPEEVFFNYCEAYTIRKIVPTVDLTFDFATKLPMYEAHKIERIAVDISPRDTLETGGIEWDKLREISRIAKHHKIKLTGLHGVRGYPELTHFQDLHGGFDSLVLCRALNENRFPCQLIWREMEAAAALEETPASNLWSNPLHGRPHV
jgi:phosphoribosylformimino-5-aminoimidazole carboxamide ribotide isomerase